MIWALEDPASASQLLEMFAHKGWKIQTMSTFLTRLVDKGVLQVSKRGKTNWFSPALSQQEYHKQKAKSVIDSMYHGSVLDFLAAFYGGKKLERSELEELREWFEEVASHD